MSGRGGIYEGPGGQKLYGDGREVERDGRSTLPCKHERLNEEGFCRSCGADKRGLGEPRQPAKEPKND